VSARHSSLTTHHGVFVTGTDTGVGKTLVACALILAVAATGRRVVGMKPVAAGAQADAQGMLVNDDVVRIMAASNVAAPRTNVNPYCFAPATAPHLAARASGVEIVLEEILAAYWKLAALAEFVVVEGVGGFCVPLNAREDSADLARHLGLPVLLVVGMRLGCLNHTLLTAQAIRAQGLRLAGWIANRIDPSMAVAEENVTALAERLAAPLLGEIEFAVAPDPQRIAALLDLSNLA
jgi:dethiobiotin synthetase